MSEMTVHDLSAEEYREYEWNDPAVGLRVYRIDAPKELHLREGGTTHRVVDAKGIVHSVPAVGQLGCALRWKPRNAAEPVQF